MDIHKRSVQVGFCVLVFALTLRLGGSLAGKLAAVLGQESVSNAIFFLQTGRVVRAAKPSPTEPAVQTEPPAPTEPAPTPAVFTEADLARVALNNRTSVSVDTAALLQKDLSWNLMQDAPSVLIYHTHGTEGYAETAGYRTRDNGYNMVSIGTAVAERLTKAGITVIHDTVTHDYPSYDGSYASSRKSIQQYLAEYPSIRLVLDLHRDAMTDSNGKQIQTTVDAGGERAAQMMLVMGTQNDGFSQNMALAVKLQALLERHCPGIMRPLCIRAQRFNQDLSAGALLIELGAAGNTRQQALKSAEILSDAIIDLSHGGVFQSS